MEPGGFLMPTVITDDGQNNFSFIHQRCELQNLKNGYVFLDQATQCTAAQ